MFELWLGSRTAPLAIPTFIFSTFVGFVLLRARPLLDGTMHLDS